MSDVSLHKAISDLTENLNLLLKNEKGMENIQKILFKIMLARTFDHASAELIKKDNVLDSTPEKNYMSDDFSIWMM